MSASLRVPCPTGPLLLGLALLLSVPAHGADGLSVPDGSLTWPRWQARLSVPEAPITRWSLGEPADLAPRLRAALLGDYDLGTFGLQLPFAQGRFRATSGLLFDLRSHHAAVDLGLASSPYLGVGWTGWVPKTGLSFSADFGWAADLPGASWRLGGALFGPQALDSNLRDLRLQPRLQLGMKYTY